MTNWPQRKTKKLRSRAPVEVIGKAENHLARVQQIQLLQSDMILRDIQMPGLDGFQMTRGLFDPECTPLVIFATSSGQHALRAFKEMLFHLYSSPI